MLVDKMQNMSLVECIKQKKNNNNNNNNKKNKQQQQKKRPKLDQYLYNIYPVVNIN